MRASWLLLLVVLLPAASACQLGTGALEGDEVTPVVSLEFPDRADCRPSLNGEYEGCETLPAFGESRTYAGNIVWYWDLDQCSTESGYLTGDMTFRLSTSELSPKWLPATFDPEEVTVAVNDYYDPTSFGMDEEQNRVYSEKRIPINVTFTFERELTDEEYERLVDSNMAARVFLKVRAEGEGTREAFGITQFVFMSDALERDTIESVNDEQAPGLPFIGVSLALVAVALRRR